MFGVVRNFLLMFTDAVCIGGCWFISVLTYYVLGGNYEPMFYLRMWPVVVAFLLVNVLFRLYHGRFFYPSAPHAPVEEFRRLVASSLFVHVGVIAALAMMRQTTIGYSRVVIIASGLLTALMAQPLRDMVRTLMRRANIGQIPVVVLADGKSLVRIVSSLQKDVFVGFKPIGYFAHGEVRDVDIPWMGEASDAVSASRERGIRHLLVSEDVRLMKQQMQALSSWFMFVDYFPTGMTFPVGGSRAITVDGVSGLEMVSQQKMRILQLEKWVGDKVLAVMVCVVAFPLLVIIGLLVVLTSRGGAFYRHTRLGRNGKPIRVWKFRTMYADADNRLKKVLASNPKLAAEWKASFKLKSDPRVTWLGRILRKTSLDELPQIFNVLGGSMAIVGPRPIIDKEVAYYGDAYTIFASVKPGMTGLWQVSGRSDTDYARRAALDVHYILNWSPWMDAWILVRTIYAVLFMRGSY